MIAVAHMKGVSFQVMDSAGPNSQKDHQLLSLFQNYLTNRGFRKNTWKLSSKFRYPLQDDNINCGIFILKFAESVLKKEYEIQPFDPATYRIHLIRLCIERCKHIMDESEIAVTSKNMLYSRFENGLFKKIEYYTLPLTISEDECHEFIVSVFGLGIKNMLSSSFSTLVNGGWITNYLIDAAFHVHMNDELRDSLSMYDAVSLHLSRKEQFQKTM